MGETVFDDLTSVNSAKWVQPGSEWVGKQWISRKNRKAEAQRLRKCVHNGARGRSAPQLAPVPVCSPWHLVPNQRKQDWFYCWYEPSYEMLLGDSRVAALMAFQGLFCCEWHLIRCAQFRLVYILYTLERVLRKTIQDLKRR